MCFLALINVAFSQSERHLINQIDSISCTALLHYNNNEIVLSFKAFNKVKKISDSINDSYGKAVSNFYLGNIYNSMHEYENAERSYTSMLKPSTVIGDNFLLANAYLSLGKLYKMKKSNEDVVSYFEKALQHVSKHNFFDDNNYSLDQYHDLMLETRVKLCEFYLEKEHLEKALINLLRLEKNINNTDTKLNSYYKNYYCYIHGLYLVKKELYNNANIKFNKAIASLEETALSNNHDSNSLLSKLYKELSLSSAETGSKEEAYLALLKYNTYNDEFINQERVRQDVIAKSKFLIEDYKNDVQIANSEKQRQLQIAKKIKNINFVITLTLVLLAISLITLLKNYISKRRLTNTLKKQNKELELAKNEALKSSELKSKFISNVTHELRTPLYGVVGITSLLLSNNSLNDRDSKFLESLKYSGDYLLNLVNEVLQFGKIESQKVELKKVSVDLRRLVENIVGSFDYKLQETNNKIEVIIDKRVPKYIKCDNVRLSQVLINLIGNSVKFTKNGRIAVRVKTLKLLDDKVDLRFEIQDSGIGVPEEKFNTIFENFSQLENSNTNYQGTGLGLSITKKIVELFGGEIELESEYGFGSTFSFNITVDLDKKVLVNSNVKMFKESIQPVNHCRILIAEDNKINQIVTRNLLEKENYFCEIVENGTEAIKVLKNKIFDLVLMDINMPIMGGIEATQLIRKFNTDIPIIALTAADVEELKENHKSIGFNGIITKPFDNYEFFQIIETNIQNSSNCKTKFQGAC
ncbi:hypothetical protein A8C32_14290 [Flavivirga aquatica]|uniref:histidine kinase n=2 Tax=Flavivirga aquatica TaxID=1849968 RepID=A0A1E5TCF5_9FLAO|nr:hypothetical protein A8C32_14290 [Flavivirga aquatica]